MQALINLQILESRNLGAPKLFMNDSSNYGLGGLMILLEDVQRRPLSFTSKPFKKF